MWIPQYGTLYHPIRKKRVSMNKKLIYIGLDVDDTQYRGAVFDEETGEIVSFKCDPAFVR
jgi:hypothetical protein